MKGKNLAISWIIGVVFVWLVIAFFFAQISAATIDGETVEQAFMGFLTNIYVIGLALFLGSFLGIYFYGEYSSIMELKKNGRKRERRTWEKPHSSITCASSFDFRC